MQYVFLIQNVYIHGFPCFLNINLKFKFLQPEKATEPPSKLVNLLHNYESSVIMKTSVSSLLKYN